ncbi:hypothetical protein PFICI_08495 [Pestalotiopsis fici W106-1]|uniref:Uncharacterized protein n=1 Tax=Pestalotiopsis fici (strain W106-1 / CGMCC3.15140) TaxID=1229662 RepID=W3WZS9_PESFW|nr:uncharacterized protein PFICI_08495 [Pestalotiopsis fici W106-1]ETS78642.1 hypothetical protein PFICI_08495 [Pestalotiopsis fici W106-1]
MYAQLLGRDAKSEQLVDLNSLIPLHMRNIHPTNDGIMFLPENDVISSPNERVVSAAIPSMLAKRLANAAKAGRAYGRTVQDHINSCLYFYRNHSVLINILPNEEQQIRTAKGVPDWTWCYLIFQRHPETMPRAFKTWTPQNTIVNPTPHGTAVIFKDHNQNGLNGSTELPLPVKISYSPLYCKTNSLINVSSTLNIDIMDIVTRNMTQVSGGLVIGMKNKEAGSLKAAIPSDLARLLKTEALRAAQYDSGRPEKSAAERVCNVVEEYMVDWTRGCIPVLFNLLGPEETTMRRRYQMPDNVATGALFVKQPLLIPQIWWDWDPAATTVECDNKEGHIAVFFKHKNGHHLVGVWIKV